MNADPDRACEHRDFEARVEVNRLLKHENEEPPTAFTASIWVNCKDCGEAFRWRGVKAGMSPKEPMCSPDETELRAPLRPASSDPDFGLGLPGFAIGYREEPS